MYMNTNVIDSYFGKKNFFSVRLKIIQLQLG